MTLIALVSAKGSPGVSTAALAFTLAWPSPTMLAECDPAGGDLLAGYLSKYEIPTDRGILPLAGSVVRRSSELDLMGQLIDLDAPRSQRLALAGITDPMQGASLSPAWPHLGELFSSLSHTVIADCGRLITPFTPWQLLARADLVLLVVRPTSLRTISPAIPAISWLRRELPGADGAESNLGLLLVGDGIAPRELTRHLLVPVVAKLAWDPKTAASLNGDGRGRRRGPLMRSAAMAHKQVHAMLTARVNAQLALSQRAHQQTQNLPVPQ